MLIYVGDNISSLTGFPQRSGDEIPWFFHDFPHRYRSDLYPLYKADPHNSGCEEYFLNVKYLSVSLCVKTVRNQHIFPPKNMRDICEKSKFHDFSMTFCQIFISHDFSRPGLFFHFTWFSMIFHDRWNPVWFSVNQWPTTDSHWITHWRRLQ